MAPSASAANTLKKSIWGPLEVGGVSQFPIYEELGVGIYQTPLAWDWVAPKRRPRRPTDPRDPAYTWPTDIDRAIKEGERHGIRVAVTLTQSPKWANGGKHRKWTPRRPADFAAFAKAAAKRYPGVRYWMIWGEPTRTANFQPLTPETRNRPLNRQQARAPRVYSRILDGAYAAIKSVDRGDLVIGGNSFTTGDISPRNWIRYLRLPNGKPPRMDLYGHNPFTNRRPNLRKRLLPSGFADFSDLDTLVRWLDRVYVPGRGKRLKLFLSEFFIPTDHPNHEFDFYVSRNTAASWLRSALRITRRWSRIYTLGWLSLYDDPLRPDSRQVERGLLDRNGNKKPAYDVFRDG